MLTQGSSAVTRMAHAGGEDLYNSVIVQEEGSPSSTYAIVMVSLSGSLLLLVAIGMAVSVLRRRCASNYSSKDLRTPVVVEKVTVGNCSSDRISTVDLTGPMCINYISYMQNACPATVSISEEKISISDASPLTTPSNSAPEQ